MIALRPYQTDGLNKIWDYFQNGGKGNPLICWPTGTGKSIVPAIFINSVMRFWPNQRFMLITHVKELIDQNAKVLKRVWPDVPLGIFSAGLKSKETAHPIVYAGIQSAIKNPSAFGFRDIIFIDEAHLISLDESSQYLTFLATMKLINPHLKVIGMTATPFRMGMGYITDGGLFTDIVHDLTGVAEFNKLIENGHLATLIPKRTKTQLDISNVGIAKGEFIASQLEKAVDRTEITYAGLREFVDAFQGRHSGLLFASGIEHANHIAEMLQAFGIECASVHSKQTSKYNDAAIKAFKNFELPTIVNFGKLTTGFDHPAIDIIGMFRPTLSVPLWVQMLGRGTRPFECDEWKKENCLCLDYAKNTIRLGPINDPVIPRKKGEKPGDAPVKICEACGTYNYASARVCINCGQEFEFKVKIVPKAGTEELLRSDAPIIEQYDVVHVIYIRGQKIDKITKEIMGKPYIKCTYFVGGQSFNEFVFPEGGGPMRHKFKEWWKQRHTTEPPLTTDEALKHTASLRCPRKVKVRVNIKFPEVLSVEY